MLVAEKSSSAPESADISDLTQYCFSKKNFRSVSRVKAWGLGNLDHLGLPA